MQANNIVKIGVAKTGVTIVLGDNNSVRLVLIILAGFVI